MTSLVHSLLSHFSASDITQNLERWITHYSSSQRILLVGEGDFSFSSALASAFGLAINITATSLDSLEEVLTKYRWAGATLTNLSQRGAKDLHNVDARTMVRHVVLSTVRFDVIVWNMPHAGFFERGESHASVIKKHKILLESFFSNASKLLADDGEVHVSHHSRGPYKKWDIENLAQFSGLQLKECVPFLPSSYPGYRSRRGVGEFASESFALHMSKTYKFVRRRRVLNRLNSVVSLDNWLTPKLVSVETATRTQVRVSQHRTVAVFQLGGSHSVKEDTSIRTFVTNPSQEDTDRKGLSTQRFAAVPNLSSDQNGNRNQALHSYVRTMEEKSRPGILSPTLVQDLETVEICKRSPAATRCGAGLDSRKRKSEARPQKLDEHNDYLLQEVSHMVEEHVINQPPSPAEMTVSALQQVIPLRRKRRRHTYRAPKRRGRGWTQESSSRNYSTSCCSTPYLLAQKNQPFPSMQLPQDGLDCKKRKSEALNAPKIDTSSENTKPVGCTKKNIKPGILPLPITPPRAAVPSLPYLVVQDPQPLPQHVNRPEEANRMVYLNDGKKEFMWLIPGAPPVYLFR